MPNHSKKDILQQLCQDYRKLSEQMAKEEDQIIKTKGLQIKESKVLDDEFESKLLAMADED